MYYVFINYVTIVVTIVVHSSIHRRPAIVVHRRSQSSGHRRPLRPVISVLIVQFVCFQHSVFSSYG